MKTITFTAGSITQAIKIKKLLTRSDIFAKVIKIPNSDGGCKYGVTINDADFYSAVNLIKTNGLEYKILSEGK